METTTLAGLTEPLLEAASMYPPLRLTELAIMAYFRVLKGCDLALIRRALVALLADEDRHDVMPTARQILAVVTRLRHGESERQTFQRCAHTDERREPSLDDAYERHWRCPAVFPVGAGEAYCPLHRGHYHHGPPATPEEIAEVFAEALAAHPDRAFLQQVVAARTRRVAAGASPVAAATAVVLGAITSGTS